MAKLPMKKSITFSEQINIKVDPKLKSRVKMLIAHGVEFNDLGREYLIKAIEFAEKELDIDGQEAC